MKRDVCDRCGESTLFFVGYVPKGGFLCKTCYDSALKDDEITQHKISKQMRRREVSD